MEFPATYLYPAVKHFPHHIMSLENGRLFFVNCYRQEHDAVAHIEHKWNLDPQKLRFLIQGTARYSNGKLIEAIEPRTVDVNA